ERQMQYEFSFPFYYGRGLRLALFGRTAILDNLTISTRLGYTNYFNRSTIGSGLQQIDASHQTDLDLQLRWKF
ncbi:MAG: helix-hairpin-helix domain-containing protein, partial [Prevotella sp.]|nr:helix-hairpin-helix domain-containing protein [Prevotella sp.]